MNRKQALALGRLDGHDQAGLIARGDVHASELTEAAIIRMEDLDPELEALTECAFDEAMCSAQSPLPPGPVSGVPCLVKDSLDWIGLPTRSGSRAEPDAAKSTQFDYADRLADAGLIVVGKTAMPEYGLLPVTEPLSGPVTTNPWACGISPGGSSGGAAAAVAAGLVPFAHGGDGAGSIRIPASCCGVVGFKPGRGATTRARASHPIEDLLVCDGLITRTIRDAAAGFALARVDRAPVPASPAMRRLRIAVVEQTLTGQAPHPDCLGALRKTADLCANLGHRIDLRALPVDGQAADHAERVLWMELGSDCAAAARARGQNPRDVLEPWTCALADMAATLPPDAIRTAMRRAGRLTTDLAKFHEAVDVILTPTLARPPPMIGDMHPGLPPEELMEAMFGWLGYTPLQNLAGSPAISLPLHLSPTGLPIGVMVSGARGGEDTLLSLSYELEQVLPWGDRWPQLSVMRR